VLLCPSEKRYHASAVELQRVPLRISSGNSPPRTGSMNSDERQADPHYRRHHLVVTIIRPVLRSPVKGAETLVWLAMAPATAIVGDGYYFDKERRAAHPAGQDMQAARRLWEISEARCTNAARPIA
jgi:hypothetical protein